MDKTKSTTAADASTGATSRPRANIRMMQSFFLLWLHNVSHVNSVDAQSMMTEIRSVTDTVHMFSDRDQSIDFLTDADNDKAFMIISSTLCQSIVPLIHDVPHLHSIFIHCKNKNKYEQWAKDWPIIKGVFTGIVSICAAIRKATYQSEQNNVSISFVAPGNDLSIRKLDQLNCSFMYTQIIKEILLTIKFEEKHINKFIEYSRNKHINNESSLKKINKLEQEYHNQTPIWWYTSEYLLYSALNRALRIMEVDIIIKMGFFINDLHLQTQKLHVEQFSKHHTNDSFTVYRGQGMSEEDFAQLVKTKGGLMSFNNFLSTSKTQQVSLLLAESNSIHPDLVGILFVMKIDPAKSTTPFACVTDVSNFQEEDEVLFSMHTVFRICDIKPIGENQRLFQVDLTLTDDNDEELRVLTNHIREETFPDSPGWYRLGLVLGKMGQPEKAQQAYEILLDETTDAGGKAAIYHQIGGAKRQQGKYNEAITSYEKALTLQEQLLPPNHPDLASSYNNIGLVYDGLGKYSKALSSYEKAIAIRQQSLSPNHPDLASSYNNIGLVYNHMGEYSKALSYSEKALAIRQQSLPPNHPSLATSHSNIAVLYNHMGKYSKALSSHEEALKIEQQSLPPNHPDLACSYDNIGAVYLNMGEYSKALSYSEKALASKQRSLPSSHPHLASSYNHIGAMYANMGEHSKALPYFEKALEIQQDSLPPNHPKLASSYNNIGSLYGQMSENAKALSYFEKALVIRQQSLSPNHPNLASSYNNIGSLYGQMGENAKALPYFEKALVIRQQSLHPNHPDLANSYDNIGNVYQGMGENSKALSSLEKALAIRQQSLSPNHPELACSYNNIGAMYANMGEYSKALSSYEKALAIEQQSLPPNHPSLAVSHYNIGAVYEKMGDFPKVQSSYEGAVDIGQHSLSSNHPHLQIYRNSLEKIKQKM